MVKGKSSAPAPMSPATNQPAQRQATIETRPTTASSRVTPVVPVKKPVVAPKPSVPTQAARPASTVARSSTLYAPTASSRTKVKGDAAPVKEVHDP